MRKLTLGTYLHITSDKMDFNRLIVTLMMMMMMIIMMMIIVVMVMIMRCSRRDVVGDNCDDIK